VIQASKSILLQCNKFNYGLIFSSFRGVRDGRATALLLIPGLNCSARLYAEQIPALGRFGPVEIADCTRDSSMDAIAARILADAPESIWASAPARPIMRHALKALPR
jgi:hypothetical protein